MKRCSVWTALACATILICIAISRGQHDGVTPKLAGDGQTDDTEVLQALVNRGGSIRLPRGEYRISRTITLDLSRSSWTSISGDAVARLRMAGPGPAFRVIGTHRGTADPSTVKAEVWGQERAPSLDGLEIFGEHPEADGVEADGTMQLTLTRLQVHGCRHGVRLLNSNRNVIVAECQIYDNRGVGVYLDTVNLHQINVVGCHISYNQDGGIVVRGGEVRNLQITGCDIEANQGKDRPATANVLIDSNGGSNAEVAITGNTIQHSNEAPASANIRILGPSISQSHTDERRDGHVTITGNIVSDAQFNLHFDQVRGAVVMGNTFWSAFDRNFLIEHSSSVVIGSNVLDRNPRYGKEETPTTTNAVVFRDCQDCSVIGLHLYGARAAEAGVLFERCDRFHVANCTILDCEPIGLYLKNVTRSRVAGCMIRSDRTPTSAISMIAKGGGDNVVVDNACSGPIELPEE